MVRELYNTAGKRGQMFHASPSFIRVKSWDGRALFVVTVTPQTTQTQPGSDEILWEGVKTNGWLVSYNFVDYSVLGFMSKLQTMQALSGR